VFAFFSINLLRFFSPSGDLSVVSREVDGEVRAPVSRDCGRDGGEQNNSQPEHHSADMEKALRHVQQPGSAPGAASVGNQVAERATEPDHSEVGQRVG
jgi:hypothetical protein